MAINYGQSSMIIGIKSYIIQLYYECVARCHKKPTSNSEESLPLTTDMSCNRIIESTWKKYLSDPSQAKYLAENEILYLYVSIRAPKLIPHFNSKCCFVNNEIRSTKKITINRIPLDGNLESGEDFIVTLQDRSGKKVVIGTTSEFSRVNLPKKIKPLGKVSSEILESMNRLLSNLTVEQLQKDLKRMEFYSYHCREIDTEEIEITSPKPGSLRLGEDVVDSGEHEMAIDEYMSPEHDWGWREDVVDSDEDEMAIDGIIGACGGGGMSMILS